MNMPFSRPGAVDLSGLRRPATGGSAGPATSRSGGGGAYSVEVTEQSFQAVVESSMTAPVVLVVYSPSRLPASAQLADDFDTLADELDGRILVGRIDVDSQPAIAQALQVQAVPLVLMLLQGRPAPLLQDAPPLDELRTLMNQLVEQLTSQGMTARHQPVAEPEEEPAEVDEDQTDPRYAPAEEALVAGDVDQAVAEYQKLVDANPADTEAVLGLSRAKLMQRTQGADLTAARTAAAERPDDLDAQLLVADLDLLGGHVDDAFDRLLELVRRNAGDDRDRARLHLIELFAVVGNDDPRVLRGRQMLASALF